MKKGIINSTRSGMGKKKTTMKRFAQHPLGKMLIVAIGYYTLAQVAIRLTIMPEGIVTFWPPNAVVVTALVLSPSRHWGLILLTGIAAEFAADIGYFPLWQIAGFGLVNATEAFLTAFILRRWGLSGNEYGRLDVRLAIILGGVFLFVSTPVAALGGGALYILGDPSVDYWSFWRVWWFGDAIGLLVLTPFFLVWAGEPLPKRLKIRNREFELFVLLALVVGFGGVTFFAPQSYPAWLSSPSLLLPAIAWGAVRFGLHGSTAITVLIAFMAAAGTTRGYGPFITGGMPAATVLAVQEYILVSVILSLSLGATFRQLNWAMDQLEMERHLLEQRVEERTEELKEAWQAAEKNALTDGLTGLNNRRAFYQYGAKTFEQAKRYERLFTVIMMDIDHFKRINDTYGHAMGDTVLVSVAGSISRVVRSSDICGRLGGEEFAICLPETSLDEGVALAERLRKSIAELPFYTPDEKIVITASFGIAERVETDEAIDNTINRADDALYQAKQKGRNRVCA